MFLQCVSTVIIVYIIISLLNSYLHIHWYAVGMLIIIIIIIITHYREGERDMAVSMCGKLSRDWLQISLILLLALSLIVGEELAVYVMLVLVYWAP